MWFVILGVGSAAAWYFGFRGKHKVKPVTSLRPGQFPQPPTQAHPKVVEEGETADITKMRSLMQATQSRFGIFRQEGNNLTVIQPVAFFDGDPVDALKLFDQYAVSINPDQVLYIWDKTRGLDGPVATRIKDPK